MTDIHLAQIKEARSVKEPGILCARIVAANGGDLPLCDAVSDETSITLTGLTSGNQQEAYAICAKLMVTIS